MFASSMEKINVNGHYTVKKLSELAGVSVRTLHLYDEIGLLKPSVRTGAGYRMYGETELLRLQQILFYKELGISLQDIASILDHPEFDIVQALESHREALKAKKERLHVMLNTIDNTITKIKKGMKLKHEELYQGLPKEKAEAWRNEAIEKYGEDSVERSEKYLLNMTKESFVALQQEQIDTNAKLVSMVNEDPESDQVQEVIARHYVIIRKYWGTHGSADKQAEAYGGLGELYVNDERFTMVTGKPNPAFAQFMQRAMSFYAKTKLQ
jgi:DNA-binding transcriptional MerR regulator